MRVNLTIALRPLGLGLGALGMFAIVSFVVGRSRWQDEWTRVLLGVALSSLGIVLLLRPRLGEAKWHSVVAGVVALAAIWVDGATLTGIRSMALVATFVAATFEEIIFRVILIRRFHGDLLRAGLSVSMSVVLAMVGAQVLFAASHAVALAVVGLPLNPVYLARLVTVGMLYAILVEYGGLWIAIASHAWGNAVATGLTVARAQHVGLDNDAFAWMLLGVGWLVVLCSWPRGHRPAIAGALQCCPLFRETLQA